MQITDNKYAARLLGEAMMCFDKPQSNANGGEIQIGEIYWRVAKVLEYADSILDEKEGLAHAQFIRNTHGILAKFLDE